MRFFSHAVLLARLLSLATLATISVTAAAQVTLKDVLLAAQTGIEARISEQNERGAEADVLSADHAPLPTLSGKLSQIDLQNGIGGGNLFTRKRIDQSVGIDWTHERGNKRALRTQAARNTLVAVQAESAETRTQQMIAAQSAYFDWLAARERFALVSELRAGAAEATRVAKVRQSAGDLSAQDAVRVEIDEQRVIADSQSALLELERAEIALNPLVAHSKLVALRSGNVIWPSAIRDTSPSLNDQDERVQARNDVKAARSRTDAARAAFENSLALRKVDPTWGVSFDRYPGTSNRLVEVRVQIPLTLGYNYQGEISRAQAELSQAELNADRALRDARQETNRLIAEARIQRRRSEQFDTDILPRAATVLRQAEFAFARGAMPLTDLLDARRTHRATLVDAVAARADAARAETALALRTEPERLFR